MENKELKDRIKFKIAMSEIDDEEKAKMKNKKVNVINKIATAACFVILISGITFADKISARVYDIYSFRKNETIQTKLPEEIVNDEKRLEEVINNKNSIIPWNEKAADVIETNNVKVNITDVAMDDYFMIFEGNVTLPEEVTEKMPIENIYMIRFIDLVIKDENNNILFCMEENKLKEIFETDDVDSIRNNPKYCISEVIDYGFKDYSELGKNPFKFSYMINTRIPSIYPKSKKLTFEFTKIALDAPEASIGISDKHYLHQDQTLTVIGDWKIDVDVSSKYHERENIIAYTTVESDPNPKNELIYCYYQDGVMHARFNLESEERRSGPWGSVKLMDMFAELDVDPMISNYIIYKICSSDEYKELDAWQDEVFVIDELYIENSNGERSKQRGLLKREGDKMVEVSKSSWGAGNGVSNGILRNYEIPGYIDGNYTSPNGTIFDIDEDQLTDEMTIKIKYLGKDIQFKIEKMKGEN